MNSIHPWFIIVGLLLFSFQRISLTILSLVGGFNCTIIVDFVKFLVLFSFLFGLVLFSDVFRSIFLLQVSVS